MRFSTQLLTAPALAFLAGCVAVPYYAPAPIARMTPQQSAAAVRPLDPAERERLAKQNAEVQREQDSADAEEQRAAALSQNYAYGAYPWYGGYYGYPGYYPGYYPYWPGGVSLSFGYVYRGGWGHRGWGGRGWGNRGWGNRGWGGRGWGGGGGGHHR